MRQPSHLTKLLIVAKDERPVLYDGTARRASELVAAERRLAGVEGVASVQRTVPQEFEKAAMELIRSRFVDCGNHAAAGPSVLGSELVGQYPELTDRFDTQVYVQSTAGAGVGVIVHHQAIDEKDISRGPAAGNGERLPIAAGRWRIRKSG